MRRGVGEGSGCGRDVGNAGADGREVYVCAAERESSCVAYPGAAIGRSDETAVNFRACNRFIREGRGAAGRDQRAAGIRNSSVRVTFDTVPARTRSARCGEVRGVCAIGRRHIGGSRILQGNCRGRAAG